MLPKPTTYPCTRGQSLDGGGQPKSIDRIYPGQAVIQQVFGKPDKTQGQFWAYTGMNLTDGQGNRYGQFGLASPTTVQQVRFDK